MGYYAVKGGTEAIENSRELVEWFRLRGGTEPIEMKQIQTQFRLAVDKVMGEASLYAPEHAALALKQAEGDVFEAAFILRAWRATLDRRYRSETLDTRGMDVIRRISSTFREIPGGQILGPTRDYTQRLLDTSLATEGREKMEALLETVGAKVEPEKLHDLAKFGRVSDLLRKEGLLKPRVDDDRRVVDITREAVKFPAPRSASLQMLARAETGGLMALAYAGMRGHGNAHGTVGELRIGRVEVRITDKKGRQRYIGRVMLSECEMVEQHKGPRKGTPPQLTIGYGLCYGHNETKAICMGLLDAAIRNPGEKVLSQEFVLYHTEGVEAMGYTNHLKLPHYVTFQSQLKNLRSTVKRMNRTQVAPSALPVEA